MKDGFIRVAAATPEIQVADCVYNREQIEQMMKDAYERDASLIVFPELCLTGYTCGDLFLQDLLLSQTLNALNELLEVSKECSILTVVGKPLGVCG